MKLRKLGDVSVANNKLVTWNDPGNFAGQRISQVLATKPG